MRNGECRIRNPLSDVQGFTFVGTSPALGKRIWQPARRVPSAGDVLAKKQRHTRGTLFAYANRLEVRLAAAQARVAQITPSPGCAARKAIQRSHLNNREV